MSATAERPLNIGMLLFDNLDQLDLTGPFEVFARFPNTQIHLVAASLEPVHSAPGGLKLSPTVTMQDAPQLDIVTVPGGGGVGPLMEDAATLNFLQKQANGARYMSSVCTGALVLGAAGLLRGYRATTHWLSFDLLELFGALPVNERVVIDRDRVTGGGVTAGIDFGLALAAEIFGASIAKEIQLMMEYDPAPPFASGSPRNAEKSLVAKVEGEAQVRQAERRAIAERSSRKLLGLG